MDIEHIHASEDSEKMVAALQHDGAVIVEDFLDADLLSRFNADVDPLMDDTPRGGSAMFNDFFTWFYGPQTRTITGLAGKSPRVRDRSAHPSALPRDLRRDPAAELRVLPAQRRAAARSRARLA